MKKITLEELNSRILYNPVNGTFTWLFYEPYKLRWNQRLAGKPALCAPHSQGYLFGTVANCKLFAHRAAWAMHYGFWPDGEIDHINHNKTDNRISNLRSVNTATNAMNKPKSKRNTSGVTGVFKHTQTGRWQAQIRSNRKSIHLGSFDVLEDAVLARKTAEENYGFHKNHGL